MSNLKDPFYEKPLHKAYYHPTRQKKQKGQLKKSQISSPERRKEASDTEKLRNDQFLKGSNKYRAGMPQDISTVNRYDERFDESWPESERPSTLSIPEIDDFGSVVSLDLGYGHRTKIQSDGPAQPDKPQSIKQTTKPSPGDPRHHIPRSADPRHHIPRSAEQDKFEEPVRDRPNVKDSESTLSKYINRFRFGPATSKGEREKSSNNNSDFWWLRETPSDSSTPRGDTKTQARVGSSKLKQSTVAKHDGSMRQQYEEDEHLRELQSRADHVLEHAESSLNSSEPAVSTDGLGSSTLSNTTYSEQAYRPQFVRADKENIPNPIRSSQPEEDILYQWRLRRKMEVAKERLGGPGLGGAKARHDPKDIDTKLTAFRRKLKMAAIDLSDTGKADGLRPQHVVSTDTKAGDKLTDKVKVAEVAIQTSSEKLNQTALATDIDADIQQTQEHTPVASPILQRRDGSRSPGATESLTPVASPCLQRKAESESAVPSHVHLSCDIIPCPKHKQCSHQDESDSSFERLKAKHMRALEAESRSASEHSDRNVSSRSRRKMSKKSRKYKYVSSSSEDEQVPVKDSAVNKPEVISGHVMQSANQRTEVKQGNNARVRFSSTPETDRVPNPGEVSSNENVERQSNHQQVKFKLTNQHTEAPTCSKEQPKPSERQSFKEKKPQILAPQKHSSPKHPVQSTIGKVIGERLFAGSVASSIDAADSSYIGRHLVSSWEQPITSQRSPEVVQEETESSTDKDLENVICSDGEEFPDDDILIDLRKRRTSQIQQLHVLNGLLEQDNAS